MSTMLGINDSLATATAGCPVDHGQIDRRTLDVGEPTAPHVRDNGDGTWTIDGFEETRQILRSQVTRQAGFQADLITSGTAGILKKLPILYLDGEEHHRNRRETNRFFTPSITDTAYREFMNDYADDLIANFRKRGRADVSDISMDMAVRVAAQIVGLTDSMLPGLHGRLQSMLNAGEIITEERPGLHKIISSQFGTVGFLLLDVKPAIRKRRKNPRSDVISYLIERGYSDIEILTECVVYGVAGMVTTREFICAALWHLLDNPRLLERMRVGEEAERYAILYEILRLEPVVGSLYRHIDEPLTITTDGEDVTIPAGATVELHIAAANADDRAFGESPLAVCPARDLADAKPKIPAYGLSFGDGAHRCPGAYVAIQETDVFLSRLLKLDGLRIEKKPDVSFNPVAKGYELRNFVLVVD